MPQDRHTSANEMLQRLHGTAWPDAKELKVYLDRLDEAERRDHRKLGRQMDLFHFQDEAVGAVFGHTKGWQLFRTLVEFMRQTQGAAGYREVASITVIFITLLTLGVAIIARSFGLKVGIRAD